VVGYLRVRLLACVVLVSALALWTASVASADTQIGTQDSNVTVMASLTSNGRDPNVANRGDWVTARVAVKSNVFAPQWLTAIVFGDIEGTQWAFERTTLKEFGPGKVWGWTLRFPVLRFLPSGVYHLNVIGISPDVLDSSTGFASIQVNSGR
jgi:hypothetical protein